MAKTISNMIRSFKNYKGEQRYRIVLQRDQTTTGKREQIGSYDSKAWAEDVAMRSAMKGIIDVPPTVLGRSTTISHMIDSYGIRVAMAQVNHRRLKTTDRYNQLTPLSKVKPKLSLVEDDAKED